MKKRLSALLAALVAAFLFSGCRPLPVPTPGPEPTPTQAPMETPTPEPTVPPVVTPLQFREGRVHLRFYGLDKAPLTCADDVQILATLTYEQTGLDKSLPVVELDLMGNTSLSCPERPCNRNGACATNPDLMGLRVRYTANIEHDASEPDEARHCGEGMNYHHRLALGTLGPDGSLDVWVSLDSDAERIGPQTLTVATPVDSWSVPVKMDGSMGLGRAFLGSPWKRRDARAWGWDAFSAHRWARMEVLGWEVSDAGEPVGC